jgi:YD repeat-containing protein
MRTFGALVVLSFLSASVASFAQVQQPDSIFKSTHDNISAADPFDVGTGIYYREYEDLFVKDTIPIDFVRTQRNMDPRSRSFGIGGSTSYDMFIIGDVSKFSWVALVLADGGQERYVRVSPGTGFADGVFENKTTLDRFYGSRIAWNQHGGWKVSMRDGTELTIQGCGATSKPGQCAVTEIKNPKGDRLTVLRDREGNILRITSPHGHTVSLENDSQGRITKAQDDSGHSVRYEYDENGSLKKASNWRGITQQFRYDDRFNMLSVRERTPGTRSRPACSVTVTNRFDEKNRFAGQKVSTGEFASVKYTTVASGDIRAVGIHSQDGLEHFFFNDAGYSIREDFSRRTAIKWSLRRVRDPQTNAVLDVRLQCRTAEIQVPVKLDGFLEKSQLYIPYFSRYCEQIDGKHKSEGKTLSSSLEAGRGGTQ